MICTICKKEKDDPNRWVIREHGFDKPILREFRICQECASELLRKIAKELNPEIDINGSLSLKDLPVIDDVILDGEGLSIVISMDLAKARKIILEHVEGE